MQESTVHLIGVIIILVAIRTRLRWIVLHTISLDKSFPRWLVWIIKFVTQPDALSVCQALLLIPICLTDSAYWIIFFQTGALILDGLDGQIARLFPNTQTEIGKFLDPVMDKILTTGTAIKCWRTFGFDGTGQIVLVVMLLLDFLLCALAFIRCIQRFRRKEELEDVLHDKEMAANYWGKAKRVLQSVSFIAFLFNTEIYLTVNVFLYITTFFAAMSLVGHTRPNWKLYQTLNPVLVRVVRLVYKPEA